jgi:hypothetical protein
MGPWGQLKLVWIVAEASISLPRLRFNHVDTVALLVGVDG